MHAEKETRLAKANNLLVKIASCGRKFFSHEGAVSRLERDARGRIWIIDKWSKKRIYTHCEWGHWPGFSDGGTLRALIINLRKFIVHGDQLRASTFGPWPKWICDGDLWGYGDDMQLVRDEAENLGITSCEVKE